MSDEGPGFLERMWGGVTSLFGEDELPPPVPMPVPKPPPTQLNVDLDDRFAKHGIQQFDQLLADETNFAEAATMTDDPAMKEELEKHAAAARWVRENQYPGIMDLPPDQQNQAIGNMEWKRMSEMEERMFKYDRAEEEARRPRKPEPVTMPTRTSPSTQATSPK